MPLSIDKNMSKGRPTKYRLVSNGYYEYLQYKKEKKFLFIKYARWEYVFRPYYDKIAGRFNISSDDAYICSLNTNIHAFVERWGNIEDYFVMANREQAQLVEEAKVCQEETNKKKQRIEYLN